MAGDVAKRLSETLEFFMPITGCFVNDNACRLDAVRLLIEGQRPDSNCWAPDRSDAAYGHVFLSTNAFSPFNTKPSP